MSLVTPFGFCWICPAQGVAEAYNCLCGDPGIDLAELGIVRALAPATTDFKADADLAGLSALELIAALY